jgi:hypothetical protein
VVLCGAASISASMDSNVNFPPSLFFFVPKKAKAVVTTMSRLCRCRRRWLLPPRVPLPLRDADAAGDDAREDDSVVTLRRLGGVRCRGMGVEHE